MSEETDAPPLVSVVTPTYQRRAMIGDAVESVLAQTLRSFELIVVDDGSTDGTVEMLRERFGAEPRLRILVGENRGVSAARNTALDCSRGRYVSFLDSDDSYLPDYLAEQVALLEAHPEVDLVHCDALLCRPDRTEQGRLSQTPAFLAPFDLEAMFAGGSGLPGCMMLRGDVARRLRFREDYAVAEDTELLFRFFLTGYRIRLHPAALVRYTVHEDPLAPPLSGDVCQNAQARLRMMREYRSYGSDPSAYERVDRYLCRRVSKFLAAEGRYREARPFLLSWLRRRPLRPRAIGWLLAGFVPGRGAGLP